MRSLFHRYAARLSIRRSPSAFATGDRVVYVKYASSSQDSRAAKALSGKAFSGSTARNWRTVLALQEMT